ncbi:MAG: glycoside hydrolase family 95 protein [Porphyromonadaceae bacterium]|nr:glycoside hydrolase family 95 protein [Porphyromonadaceae bacterium]
MPIFSIVALMTIFSGCPQNSGNDATQCLQLIYDKPAGLWEETLPLGNGLIGMMPDGGVNVEQIVLNDITMWSGSEDPKALNPKAIQYLPQIRELLLAGKNNEAQQLMYRHFRCGGEGSGRGSGKNVPYGSFQMLGNLQIRHTYANDDSVSDYRRTLSLNDAVATTEFNKGDVHYLREYFASFTDDVLIIRLSASKKKSIGFSLELSRPERATISVEEQVLNMEGQLNDGYNGDNGIRYFTKLQIVNKGGRISSDGKGLSLSGADEALIIVSTSTNMLEKQYKEKVSELLNKARATNYDRLKSKHIEKYQEKFNRVELNLGDQDDNLPTDRRLHDFQEHDDPALAALYFQYGRYLMICGTNKSSLPLNLQGLWANTVQTPWNGDYHLNINLQMNYWPAEVCNLPELHQPLLNFTQSLVPSGTKTAKTFYGADGWIAHMMSNPWKFTAPGEHASWGATNTGGAWLCAHLWEHYVFTQDKEYLRAVYPTLAGAARFFLSSMIAEPKNGWLVTAPSSSPENGFYMPGSRDQVFVCMGPTMDVQIIRELFANTLSAAKILEIEDETTAGIRNALPKLPPMQISEKGYLMEWLEDYEEADPQHRHVSHLYGLYPSNQISPHTTPALASAARVTLERRGDGGTGWSRAWKVNFWARLQDGNRAYKLLKRLMQPALPLNAITYDGQGSGTYPNLFCAHPPFQIDGNFGGTSGIAEMLIQSQDGYIHLLPALPDAWNSGSFKGLRVRGGAEVDISWCNKQITSVTLRAITENRFKLKAPGNVTSIRHKNRELHLDNGFIFLTLDSGESVKLELHYE